VQVASIKTRVECAWFQRLKLQYSEALSNIAFNFNVRRYNQDFEYIVSPADLITPGVNIKVECWDKAGPARYCPPRHPMHVLDLNSVSA
jgi:hypothetical protein